MNGRASDVKSPQLRLDEIYKMVSRIYGEQNAHRPASATFAHFVEVCGMLATHSRNKKHENFTLESALCKALAWYFPLMAKFKVRSVEELIFRKYPYVCPYCRLEPHKDNVCKTVRGTEVTVNHDELRSKYRSNSGRRPTGLNAWQKMFSDIYPRSGEDREGRSIAGLFEELGELAEAVRVFDSHPKYFAGEAADVFSYLMGVANEYSLKLETQGKTPFSFEAEFIKRYPGLCVQCGYSVCVCPIVPEATVGRLAKELDLSNDDLFSFNASDFSKDAELVANRLLKELGGYKQIATNFPFDRGQANKALVSVCLRMAESLETHDAEVAEKLRSAAIRLSQAETKPGTSFHFNVADLLKELESSQIQQSLIEGVGKELQTRTISVLLVSAGPSDQDPLRLQREQRAIQKALRESTRRDSIMFETLPSATVDDLRKALLRRRFEVVQFIGHADADGLAFETEDGTTDYVTFERIGEFLSRQDSIQCLILNACSSLDSMNLAIAPLTVGMADKVGDDAAIEFSRGFYDAIGEGKTFEEAVESGRQCAALKSLGSDLPLKVLTK